MNCISESSNKVFGKGRGCGDNIVIACLSMSTPVLENRRDLYDLYDIKNKQQLTHKRTQLHLFQ